MNDIGNNEKEIQYHLRCLAAYYSHCAAGRFDSPDGIRANILKIIIDDIESAGRVALGISRLERFLPESERNTVAAKRAA